MRPDQGPPGPPPGYGPPSGYGPPPGYGPPSGYGPPPGWGYGYVVPVWQPPPGRPGVVTAAGVLGFVAGGLTVLVSLAFVVVTSSGEGDPSTGVLSAGLPCGIAMLAGAGMLLGRRRLPVLALACVATLVVLVTAWSVVLAGPDGADPDARIGITIFTLFGAVLPVVTLVFSLLGAVRRWLAGDQPPA